MSAKLSKKLKNAKFRIIACTACGNHLILRVDGKPSLCVVAWFCHWRADLGSHGANWDARDPAYSQQGALGGFFHRCRSQRERSGLLSAHGFRHVVHHRFHRAQPDVASTARKCGSGCFRRVSVSQESRQSSSLIYSSDISI